MVNVVRQRLAPRMRGGLLVAGVDIVQRRVHREEHQRVDTDDLD